MTLTRLRATNWYGVGNDRCDTARLEAKVSASRRPEKPTGA